MLAQPSHPLAGMSGWLAQGKTNPEIAAILDVKRATVKNHVGSIPPNWVAKIASASAMP